MLILSLTFKKSFTSPCVLSQDKSHVIWAPVLIFLEYMVMYHTKSMTFIHKNIRSFQWFYQDWILPFNNRYWRHKYEWRNKCATENKNLGFNRIYSNLYVLTVCSFHCVNKLKTSLNSKHVVVGSFCFITAEL